MPKATAAASSRPALRRNQACRSCRKRKLKCDAARPHCGTCVKQWQALISVPAPVGYAHPSEPQCSYDPVEGLRLAPDKDPADIIQALEKQIASLEAELHEHQACCSESNSTQQNTFSSPPVSFPPQVSGTGVSSSGSHLTGTSSAPKRASATQRLTPQSGQSGSTGGAQFHSDGSDTAMLAHGSPSTDSQFMDLFFLGWNLDLPDPVTLNHYIDVFFRCDPCGSRILHRPSFLASMRLPPRDPSFPHSAILHAICASASRWSSRKVATQPDGSTRDMFSEFHAIKTRQYIDKTMASGMDIFAVMQACILLAWYFYQEGRWVEVWVFAAFQTRVAIPLRLNYPGTFSTHGNSSPGAYLAPPKDMVDLESRRRTWWMTIMFDRIVSVGGWIHSIDERDVGTELPLRTQDFENNTPVPSNTQDLTTMDVFTSHPSRYIDSFLLLIKSVMLFGKVTDFNVRGNLRAPTAPSKNQNPFFVEGFEALDKLVCAEFLESLPQLYRNSTGVTDAPDGCMLDTDLYMVHIIPHAAAITLHNPYIDFTNPANVSTARCVHSARSILGAYYVLSATSLDITRLHPFVTICWYLAAVVQVQLCKYFIEIEDSERESTVWGEINVLRFALREYGQRSPIGTRQEKLLQGLMGEIVRMTARKRPLEVGVPLYPFSHRTAFRKDEVGEDGPVEVDGLTAAAAPLPGGSPLYAADSPWGGDSLVSCEMPGMMNAEGQKGSVQGSDYLI